MKITKEKQRVKRLNAVRKPSMPKGKAIAAFKSEMRLLSRRESEADTDGATLRLIISKTTGLSQLGSPASLEDTIQQYHDFALQLFDENEVGPDHDSRAGWSAFGKIGIARTKTGAIAQDLLYHIAKYRRLKDDAERIEKEASWSLIQIGRLSVLLKIVHEHEVNASAGVVARQNQGKRAQDKKKKWDKLFEDNNPRQMIANVMKSQGCSKPKAREIVAGKLGCEPITLSRRGI